MAKYAVLTALRRLDCRGFLPFVEISSSATLGRSSGRILRLVHLVAGKAGDVRECLLADFGKVETHLSSCTGSLSRIRLIFGAAKFNFDQQYFVAILIVGRGNEYVSNSGVAKYLFQDRLDDLLQLQVFDLDHNPLFKTRLRGA